MLAIPWGSGHWKSPSKLDYFRGLQHQNRIKGKTRGNYREGSIQGKMDDLIYDLDLFDVPPTKGMYTWKNKRAGSGHIVVRLDQFLISSYFLALPNKSYSLILPWEGSDHRPISLMFEPQKIWGPIPLRFNPLWMNRPEFLPSISQIWNQWIIGSPNYI